MVTGEDSELRDPGSSITGSRYAAGRHDLYHTGQQTHRSFAPRETPIVSSKTVPYTNILEKIVQNNRQSVSFSKDTQTNKKPKGIGSHTSVHCYHSWGEEANPGRTRFPSYECIMGVGLKIKKKQKLLEISQGPHTGTGDRKGGADPLNSVLC